MRAHMTAKKQIITTAPAARSFAFPINGSWSVLTLSANFSMAVLIKSCRKKKSLPGEFPKKRDYFIN